MIWCDLLCVLGGQGRFSVLISRRAVEFASKWLVSQAFFSIR